MDAIEHLIHIASIQPAAALGETAWNDMAERARLELSHLRAAAPQKVEGPKERAALERIANGLAFLAESLLGANATPGMILIGQNVERLMREARAALTPPAAAAGEEQRA